MLYTLEAGDCLFCGKADIRNPLSLLAHERSRFANCQWALKAPTDISIPLTHLLVLCTIEAGDCLFCGKADIRNPLSLLAHERSRFANCQWALKAPTDISIPLTHLLVLCTIEAGDCLFCVQNTPVYFTSK